MQIALEGPDNTRVVQRMGNGLRSRDARRRMQVRVLPRVPNNRGDAQWMCNGL